MRLRDEKSTATELAAGQSLPPRDRPQAHSPEAKWEVQPGRVDRWRASGMQPCWRLTNEAGVGPYKGGGVLERKLGAKPQHAHIHETGVGKVVRRWDGMSMGGEVLGVPSSSADLRFGVFFFSLTGLGVAAADGLGVIVEAIAL